MCMMLIPTTVTDGALVHHCTSASVHQCTGSSVGRSKQLADCPPEKHLSAVLETDTCNQNVPITSQPGNLLTPSALQATELPTSSASTDQVFPLESFFQHLLEQKFPWTLIFCRKWPHVMTAVIKAYHLWP